MLNQDKLFLEAHESYVKGSYRNKAKIVTANGVQKLSIPLQKGKHQQKSIQEVKISYTENWQRQHWRSLKTAYENAPYWEDYENELKTLLDQKTETLWDYNLLILKGLLEIIQIDIPIVLSNAYEKEPKGVRDLRQVIKPKNADFALEGIRNIPYSQVFEDRLPFIPNATILDLIFCKGPETSLILEQMALDLKA